MAVSEIVVFPCSPEGFVKSVEPCADFIAITALRGRDRAVRDATLKLADASELGFFEPQPGYFVVATTFGGVGEALLSGVISLPSGGKTGPSVVDVGMAAPGRGSFTLLEWSGEALVAQQDAFGMGALYVYQNEDYAFVTNRLHLAAMAVHLFPGEVRFDRMRILASALDHMLFSAQNFTNDTYLQGVERVAIGCRVVLDASGLSLESQSGLVANGGGSGYQDALRAAWEEVCANVRLYREAFPDSELVVDVSGGRDSRVVLAAALAVLGPEGFAIHTVDVPGSDDLAVSLHIAHRFRLRYAGKDTPRACLGDGEALGSWRSYMMGEYNVLGLRATSSSGRSRRVRLSGGAGEVHRDFWAKIILGEDSGSVETIAEVAAGLATRRDGVSKRLSAASQQSLLKYVERRFGGDRQPLAEALDAHYLHYRNRAHFGQRRFSTLHDCYYAFPLLSSALYVASHSVARDSRARGDVFDDLLKLYAPALAAIPYDGSRAARTLSSGAEVREAWTAAQADVVGVPPPLGGARTRSVDEDVELAVAEACARLSRAGSPLAEVATALAGTYMQRLRSWPKDARQRASVILALDDAAHPTATMKASGITTQAEVWRFINPISSLGCVREGCRLRVSIRHSSLVDVNDYEFAFYLYVGDDRVATVWYSAETTAFFEAPSAGGRAVAFARRTGSEAMWSLSQDFE